MGEILLSLGREREILDAYSELISHLNFPYLEFQCTNCGFKPADLQWQCPQCKKWDTINLMDSNVTDPPSLINNVNKLQAEIVEYDIEKEV